MSLNEKLNCYCFNIACKSSIYNDKTCVTVQLPLSVALSLEINCIECGCGLISPVLIEIRRDAGEIVKLNRPCNVMVLDDDIIFQESVKSILKQHNRLNADFYMQGQVVLTELDKYKKQEKDYPAIIFLDLDMPGMDGWEFLKAFDQFNNSLQRSISIYIISNSVDPGDRERIKKYPYVKSFISKPLTRYFLEKMNEELVKNTQLFV